MSQLKQQGLTFNLSPDDLAKIDLWKKEIDKKIIASQKETMSASDFELLTDNGNYVYYGAIGGGLTYSFSINSLGTVVTVKEAVTGEVLDLTDYENW